MLADGKREAIVADYLAGVKLQQIATKHDVELSTVYYVLHTEGVAPNRARNSTRLRGSDRQLAALFELVEAQDERIQELEAELAAYRSHNCNNGHPITAVDA